ncbi:haloacid dehalogenase type II [uncultured Amaricoccus sp.]|mgnify:CR=1 FL=1|uniref:haloacid dehalogenase type II n=1 Tax=uncultured Amaricoccus sp. TaxID=339341 RepID=UPI0026052D65|nr:haloacid dehalogenase type II [uncultured Amaricoccus sp.]
MIKVVVFDAYDTLFDVTAAARRVAGEPGRAALVGIWPRVAQDWRRKQLEYAWLRTVMGAKADFLTVTEAGLDWALDAAGLADAGLRARLLALYRELDAFPEARSALERVRASGVATAMLSNGSAEMLDAAVRSAGLTGLFDAVLSVESVGAFKPATAAYDLVGEHFAVAATEVRYVTSNGWDAAGASRYGFDTVWVNRAAEPMDRVPWRPARVLHDLSGVPDLEENP